jgi:hypothetical protein
VSAGWAIPYCRDMWGGDALLQTLHLRCWKPKASHVRFCRGSEEETVRGLDGLVTCVYRQYSLLTAQGCASLPPDVTLTFNNPHVLDDARLHPSVRFARFAGDKALSFVPPDGEFTLMHYRCVPPPAASHSCSDE